MAFFSQTWFYKCCMHELPCSEIFRYKPGRDGIQCSVIKEQVQSSARCQQKNFVMVQVSQKETSHIMLNFIHRKSTKTVKCTLCSKCQCNFSHNSSWLVLAFFGAILSLLSLSTLTEIKSHITSSAKINELSLPHTSSWCTWSKAKPLPNESAINFKTFNRSVKWSMQAMLHLCL